MPRSVVRKASRRTERISLRATAAESSLIEQAALLTTSGNVTRFVTRAAIAAAQEAIARHDVAQVTDEMRKAFYGLLLNPPPPGPVLQRLTANAVPPDAELVEQ